jgi:hypothetical protein
MVKAELVPNKLLVSNGLNATFSQNGMQFGNLLWGTATNDSGKETNAAKTAANDKNKLSETPTTRDWQLPNAPRRNIPSWVSFVMYGVAFVVSLIIACLVILGPDSCWLW